MITTPRPDWALGAVDTIVAYAVFGAAFLVAVGYAVRHARLERRLWPVYLLLGAGLAVVYEPINNVLALCTYPEIGQLTWISALGRRIPVYIGLVYVVYWSAPVLWLMNRIRAGMTPGQWWRTYASFTVAVTVFELLPLQRGWWAYYGAQQPLVVARFPAWWWADNSGAIFGLAAVLSLLRERVLRDDRTALIVVPLLPMLLLGLHGGPAMPVFLALGTTLDPTLIDAAGVIAVVLALLMVWLLGRLVCRERGAAPRSAPVETAAEPRPPPAATGS